MTALIELYANNAYSTLANGITSTDTTINLAPGTGARFPNPTSGTQFFRLNLTSAATPNVPLEIVYVIARSTNALTVLRGQEGTTAQAWLLGDLCANEPTAGMFSQFVQPWTGVDTGAVNAYVVSTPQAQGAYYTGMPCTFYTLNANTSTTPTLNLNGLGAKVIKNADGTALLASQLLANTPISVLYDSSDASWRLQSPLGMPTNLTPSRAAGIDPSGRITAALPTLAQLNLLANWENAIQTGSNEYGYWSINPQGQIIQYGSYMTSTNPSQIITFPIAFPNAPLVGFAAQGTAGSANWGAGIPDISAVDDQTWTQTSMQVFTLQWNNTAKGWQGLNGLGIFWLVIGN